ncbi:TorD/DmsD family molecular chaperone [Gephyromycinifex aptenodytis]|uniref:TorD/DmsD family molecular chaperone n=1 Tax=Gephyromycinifex aptenodytis TaxID=2716227 RepID=UPI0014463F1C|nr:molecular chaperone TorD family protein [Gephyromycinifex aptenodytis]
MPSARPAMHAEKPGAEVLDAFCAASTMLASVLLEPPSAEQVDRLSDLDLLTEWPQPAAARPAGQSGLEEITTSLRTDPLAELIADYRHLFDAPDHSRANPYESVRRSEEHLMLGAHTLAVRAWYEHRGLVAPARTKVPDDHLGLELAFVSTLLLDALSATEADDEPGRDGALEALRRFLGEHPLAFGSAVAQDMKAHAHTGYFRGWGRVLEATLDDLGARFA